MDRTTMSLLVHGESGTGKSWLADTAPAPRLILDIEGRAKHTPSQPKVWWDPISQSPPAASTQEAYWETCVVKVQNFSILGNVYQWLRSGQHPFKSVVVDSLMEAQKRFIDQHKGTAALTTQDWGVVLRELETFVRNMRDIVAYDEAHVDCVVIVTGSIPAERGIMRPLLQGQLKNTLPYFVDAVGYLFVAPVEGGGMQRTLQVAPSPYAVAKDGTHKLDPTGTGQVPNPNLIDLYSRLNGSEA